MEITCRIRGKPPPLLAEVILYRDGLEVMRRRGSDPCLLLADLTLRDRGLYRCRATWDTEVFVSDVLTRPVLEVVSGDGLVPSGMMGLICHVQYNAREPAPPVHYYFYKDGNRLVPASSENSGPFLPPPGLYYHCMARVPLLNLERQSGEWQVIITSDVSSKTGL